jgi:hypothetical protein
MTRRPPHLPQPEPEGDTYHNIAVESIDDETQGRFVRPKPFYTGEKGNHYPKVAATPLTSPQPDRPFDPSRDRIDPSDITDWKFGVDMTRLNGLPPDQSSSPAEPAPAISTTSLPSPGQSVERGGGSSLPRGITRLPNGTYSAQAGRGMATEHLGTFASLAEAVAAVRDAEQARD